MQPEPDHRQSYSVEKEILEAERAGALVIERTNIVFNGDMVKWSSGEMAVDDERTDYLGKGQLLEPVDTTALTATFKLSQCFPASRYFVLDHSMEPVADMTHALLSPLLQDGPSQAGATGRTNMFMNGVSGPGPTGFQPSAFDFNAGNPAWSPYWDHYACAYSYSWTDDATASVLRGQTEIHEPAIRASSKSSGVPDTNGTVFTVNCPVPVLAPTTFEA